LWKFDFTYSLENENLKGVQYSKKGIELSSYYFKDVPLFKQFRNKLAGIKKK